MPPIYDTLFVAPPRRSPALVRLLDRATTAGHEHNWEGALEGARGAAKDCTIRIKARIAFHGDVMEGAGRFVDIPDGVLDTFALSGTSGTDGLVFEIWFDATDYGRVPFLGTGELSSDAREMSGSWSVACFNPDSCGCSGGGGTFHLKRIE